MHNSIIEEIQKLKRRFDTSNPLGRINYTVWSDIFICPNCGAEIIFWNVALNKKTGQVSDKFQCSSCNMELAKKDCHRAIEPFYDSLINETVIIAKQSLVLINYTFGKKRYEKVPDKEDYSLLERIEHTIIPFSIPVCLMPEGFNTDQPKKSHGISYMHQFYTKRNLIALGALWDKSAHSSQKEALRLILTGIMQISTKQSTFRYDSRNPNNTAGGILKGTLYVPSIQREGSVFSNYKRRYSAISSMKYAINDCNGKVLMQVCSASQVGLPNNSVDYIFTDPPFGGNINYSELSFGWEAWLGVVTNTKQEAIINTIQKKGLYEYQDLMEKCFSEYHRVLKPNRWMTVEFHNSYNAVWAAIQEALQKVGFIIADVRTLDKKQGSFKQVTTTSAVKQDLVISVYKPKESFKRDFISHAGSEDTAWNFTRQHLENLPVTVVKNGKIELITERQAFLLFDRMVAYHIMNGISVPLDATDFYRGLDEKFMKRDGMYFLADQVNEYDTVRIVNDVEDIQFSLIVTNEKTAISWLYAQLTTPQTYAELQPKFMQEIKTVDKYESIPELSVLLEDSFLPDDKGKWYIPDRTKEADIAKLREKKLLKEFEGYLATKGKLKLFRTEAIRVGFAKLWADKNYKLIVETADRLPEDIIQEDDKLLMYYDLSLGRV